MTVLAQTRINPPADWQAFERASVVLWQEILGDRRLQRYGRSGQNQHGLDLLGYQDRNPAHLVGIQCKAKGLREKVTEAELREEFENAIKHYPRLSEFILATTAPDDRAIDDVAFRITEEQARKGGTVIVRVMGWDSLQLEIQRFERALLAFDPTHSSFGSRTNEQLAEVRAGQDRQHALTVDGLAEIRVLASEVSALKARVSPLGMPDATEQVARAFEAHLDAEIDGYRDRDLNGGKPRTALSRLEELWQRLPPDCSPRIRFRVRALIGHSHLRLGDEERGAAELMSAAEHAADDPKALANKVLALTVLRRLPEALELGEACLERDPTDEAVAGYVVQAASLAGEPRPEDRIPVGLRDAETVRRFLLAHHRARGDGATWRDMAREARMRAPDEELYVQMAAEADLTDVIEAFDRGEWALGEERRSTLRAAASDLAGLWSNLSGGEEASTEEALTLCHNAAAASLGCGNVGEAVRLVREGLSVSPANPSLVLKAAVLAIETADAAWAREVFPKLGTSGHELLIKIQMASSIGEYGFLSTLGPTELETLPAVERPVCEVMVEIARAKVSEGAVGSPTALVAGLRDGPGSSSVRAMVLVSRLADELDLPDAAGDAYEAAMSMVNDGTHQADRIMLARLSERRGDLFSVVQLLDGRLGDRGDAESRKMLVRAHAYVQPPLAGGPEAFAELPPDLRAGDPVVHLEGVMQFNRGDAAEAERLFRVLMERHPLEPDPVMKVAHCLLRLGRSDEIAELVRAVDLVALNGTPTQRMSFAQLLLRAGRPDDALEFGYRTLRAHRHDPDVNVRWVGLAFAAGLGRFAGVARSADVDMYVEATNDGGETSAFLIEVGADRAAEGVVSPSHPFARAVIGHALGHEYTPETHFGPPRVWTITRIEHGYVHAFRDVSENFETRFPDHKGFWRYSMQGDDIAPLLEQFRRQGEATDRVLEGHADSGLPIRALANEPGGSIAFAATLAATRREVRTCLGWGIERHFAQGAIRRGRRRGVVLDTLAAWTAFDLDAMDVLEAMFPKVLVARSTIDELRAMREELEDGFEGGGVASYLDGRFRFEERTAEGRQHTIRILEERIRFLETRCEVVAARAPVSLDRHVHSVLSALGHATMDAALVAMETRTLHLTEDRAARTLAHTLLDVEGAWLQVVLMEARRRGLVSCDRYPRMVAMLAAKRHGHIGLDAQSMADLARDPDPAYRDAFAALVPYIGNPTADIESHLRVVMGTILRLWSFGQADLAAMRATGTLLAALSRHPGLNADRLGEFVTEHAGRLPALRQYVRGWARGHFLFW